MKINSNVIDLNKDKFKSLYFCGDIHGEFEPFRHKVITSGITDSIIVLCGDIGMGFHKSGYYEQTLGSICKKFRDKNITIVALRGNHDDPKWFSKTEQYSYDLANFFDNWIFADDYDTILTPFGNILCIGGGRSVDKLQRLDWQKGLDGPYWWQGEQIKPLTSDLFVQVNQNKINIIASHSSANFAEPFTKRGLDYWTQFDEDVIKDCDTERQLLTDIYSEICKYHNITDWFYGHFHKSYYTMHYNEKCNIETKLHGLDCNELKLYNVEF